MEEKRKNGKGKLFVLLLSFLIIGICIGGILCCACYKKYSVNNSAPEKSKSVSNTEEKLPEVYSSFDGENHLVINGDKYKLNYLDGTEAKTLDGNITKEGENTFKTASNTIEKYENLAVFKDLYESGPVGGMSDLVLFNIDNMTSIKETLSKGAEKYLSEYYDGNEHAKASSFNLRNIYRCNHNDDDKDMVCIMEYFIEFENYSRDDCLDNDKYAREMMPSCLDGGISSSYAIRYNYKTLEAIELASLND